MGENDEIKKMEKFLRAVDRVSSSTYEMMWKSFLRGVFSGLGATVGVSIVLGIITYLLDKFNFLSAFKDYFTAIKK